MRGEAFLGLPRRGLWWAGLIALALLSLAQASRPLWAQKVQESFGDRFELAEKQSGVAVAISADGHYVVVAGPKGVIVSDDYGKTGTWVQTVRFK